MALIPDVLALSKPKISALSAFAALAGISAATEPVGAGLVAATLLGTGLTAASACAMNMAYEGDTDARMERTRSRPIAAGRLSARSAWWIGGLAGLAGGGLLALAAPPLTTILGLASIVLYAFVYTPLKRRTAAALLVGLAPGAAPPLLGTTAASGDFTATGLALFALVCAWQLPHVLAIQLDLDADYARGGLPVVPHVLGVARTRALATALAWALLPASLLCGLLGGLGPLYLAVAGVTGVAFALACGARIAVPGGARRVFRLSLVHIAALLTAVALEGLAT